jgi:hypothetical protein
MYSRRAFRRAEEGCYSNSLSLNSKHLFNVGAQMDPRHNIEGRYCEQGNHLLTMVVKR